ncbi:MAG: hypothetical protein ABIH26_07465 [Candidatus Eisenbacteria bacterium]
MRTRTSLALFLFAIAVAPPAAGDPPSVSRSFVKGDDHLSGVPVPGGRTEGDSIENAIPIPSLPFMDAGNTCGFADDYDEACPYPNSTSPDVVYEYAAPYMMYGIIDLCESGYDTKVYVYDFDGGYGFGNPYACNDDACGTNGFRSEIYPILFEGGHTYHIVVDGYGGDCGNYVLGVHEIFVEILTCPSGALLEGEEDCHDDYDDQFNGGCGTHPTPVFSPLAGTPGGAAFSVCGTSGTFLNDGLQFRDTDWYELHVAEENTITFECAANFLVEIVVLDGSGGCESYEILEFATAGLFPDMASITRTYQPGTYWFWVGPSVFYGVPCGSLYVMTISGFTSGPSAAAESSWGTIKTLFR